jgi:hypothetical protein
MSTALEREVREKLLAAQEDVLSGRPLGTEEPLVQYARTTERYRVLRELVQFIDERNAALAAGDIKDDE